MTYTKCNGVAGKKSSCRQSLVITVEDDDRVLTVQVNPEVWFKAGNGSVLDLSAFDFETTGRLLEFELEIEDGFTELEIDDDDD